MATKPRLVALLLASTVIPGGACGSTDGRDAGASGRGSDTSAGMPSSSGSGGSEAGAPTISGGTAGGGAAGRGGAGGQAEASAGAGEEAGSGGAADVGNLLEGRVVEIYTSRPLSGRTVVVGSSLTSGDRAQTITDERGEFALPRPTGVYDAAVIEPDGSAVTVYQGLSRRDPLLAHRWARTFPVTTRLAKVSGNVSGGATFPLSDPTDVVAVHLFTDQSVERYLMGAGAAPYGPNYVTTARFDAEPQSSVLVALGTFGRKSDMPASDPPYTAVSASATMTLSDGDMVMRDLELQRIPLGMISGSVLLPAGLQLTEMREHFRYPFPQAVMTIPAADYVRTNPLTAGGAFAFELPDLTAAGPTLCLVAVSDEFDSLWTERCGLALGDDSLSIEIQPAPVLEEPRAGATIDAGTRFAWSPFAGGVHELVIWNESPSSTLPGVTLVTAAVEGGLPDLDGLGVNVPVGAAYDVTVVGRGPFASLDDAVGPKGIGAIVPDEARISSAAPIDVVMSP